MTSRADLEFMAGFLPGTVKIDGATPPGLVITEGPLAAKDADPFASRRKLALSSARGDEMKSRTPSLSSGFSGGFKPGDDSASVPASTVRPAKTAANSRGDDIPTAPGFPLPTSAGPTGGANMTAPVPGIDVGDLPGPNTDPMIVGSAPSKGKKGPAPSSRDVANAIIQRLQSKKVDVVKNPSSSDGDDKTDKSDGERRVGGNVMTMNQTMGPDLGRQQKMAQLIRASGAPPSLVTEQSVLWKAAEAKIENAVVGDTASYITRDDVHPMALWTMLGGMYGDQWLAWDAETIEQTLKQDCGRDPTPVVMNKIAALKLVTANPEAVLTDWFTFEKVCLAFDGQAPRLSLVEDLRPEQMAMGVSVMRMLRSDAPLSFDIPLQKYCAARLFDAGFVVAPPELGFADADLVKMAKGQEDLRAKTMKLYMAALQGNEPESLDMESPDAVQAGRLLRVNAYVLDRLDDLAGQAA